MEVLETPRLDGWERARKQIASLRQRPVLGQLIPYKCDMVHVLPLLHQLLHSDILHPLGLN